MPVELVDGGGCQCSGCQLAIHPASHPAIRSTKYPESLGYPRSKNAKRPIARIQSSLSLVSSHVKLIPTYRFKLAGSKPFFPCFLADENVCANFRHTFPPPSPLVSARPYRATTTKKCTCQHKSACIFFYGAKKRPQP